MKTCTVEDCTNKYQAKGMCSMHYARQRVATGARIRYPFTCPTCDKPGEAYDRKAQRHNYCSKLNNFYPGKKLSTCTDLVHVPRLPKQRETPTIKGGFWWIGYCKQCGLEFISQHGYACCSDKCQQQYPPAKRRKDYKRHSTRKRQYIYQRDQYRCQLCYTPVDMTAHPDTDFAPELDHIIPRHLNGNNTRENLRLTHRVCNRTRNLTGDYHLEYVFEYPGGRPQ